MNAPFSQHCKNGTDSQKEHFATTCANYFGVGYAAATPYIRWAEPMRQLFRSKAAMGMGGAITAVAATTTVGTAATTMAGGIITIGGDFHLRPKRGCSR